MKKMAFYFIFLLCLSACGDEKAGKTEVAVAGASLAEDQLKAAVKSFPDSLPLKENLIQYYRENGNYDNALNEVNLAIQKDSLNTRLWDMKAILHAEDEDTSSAIKSFEKAIYISPSPEDVISLGTLYAETGNKKALELADALILADKAKAEKEALFIKGLYYAAINQKLKAITYFDECIAFNYTFMYAYREKCLALYDLGKYNDALSVINKALTLQNGYEEGYYYKGKCYEKLANIPAAIEAYQTALMYAPDYVEVKDALAKLGVKS